MYIGRFSWPIKHSLYVTCQVKKLIFHWLQRKSIVKALSKLVFIFLFNFLWFLSIYSLIQFGWHTQYFQTQHSLSSPCPIHLFSSIQILPILQRSIQATFPSKENRVHISFSYKILELIFHVTSNLVLFCMAICFWCYITFP